MKICATVTLLLLTAGIFANDQDNSVVAEKALAILDAYHEGHAEEQHERKLHVVCWRPVDREFAPAHRERLQRILEHIQNFYADEMEQNGLGRKTFNLDYSADGSIIFHEAVGEGNFDDYTKPEGERIRKECWPVLREAGLDPDRETVMIFTNLSNWNPDTNTFSHKSPYYANGGPRRGIAWQLDSPELDTLNLPKTEPLIQDGEYGKISLGKHNSIFIGGIAHELGHALGLPHCKERGDQATKRGTALMGAGNRTYCDELRREGRGTFLSLAHALRLASHPQFSGSVKGMNLPVKASFEELAVARKEKEFTVSGRVVSPVPCYAVIAYLDPNGNGDYDARTHVTVPDSDGRFSLKCSAFVHGVSGAIRVVACLANGDTATWSSAYRVHRNGLLDTSALEQSLRLQDFVEAIGNGNTGKATQIRDTFPEDSHVRKVATSILTGRSPDRSALPPQKVPTSEKSFPLSHITPTRAEVGWLKPAYDCLPRNDLLFFSGDTIYETGIYAHAPATHEYLLEGGHWQKLTGRCGLPHQSGGSVVFRIVTDGKEVFRSPVTKPGRTYGYDIDLLGVKQLQLITEDAGDGNGRDWGLWLAPTLER